MSCVIGIDLGGTRIKAGLVNLTTGELTDRQILQTDDFGAGESWKAAIRQMVNELAGRSGERPVGIGIAAPGIVEPDGRSVKRMPGRLEGLEGFVWEDFLGLKTRVTNDAQAALLAEAYFGNMKGYHHGLLVTLGTGVGGALWLDGKLYRGGLNFAGHLGHMTTDADSPVSGITRTPGSLEYAIGNYSVEERSYGRYTDTAELVAAYEAGEPVATHVWLNSVKKLAVGIASLINVFSPEMILLGGGIAEAETALFAPLEAFLDLFEWRLVPGEKVKIRKTQYGEWAGTLGAAIGLNNQD